MRLLLAVAVACALALRACDRPSSSRPAPVDAGFNAAARDDTGHDVIVSREPRRIVSLLPSHTEVLFALGVGDRVVAVDTSSDFPSEVAKLPRVGGLYDPHLEEILALAPDLVLSKDAGPAPERLRALGVTVWAGSGTRLDDAYRLVDVIGRLVGRAAEAQTLVAHMHAEVDAASREARALPRVRVYDELDPTPYTVGPESFLGALIDRAGGDNIVPAGLGDFPRISPELVVAKDPEVILGVALADLARRPGWSSITAVKRGRAELLTEAEQGLVSRPGPRIAAAIAVLARHIHGPHAADATAADAGAP